MLFSSSYKQSPRLKASPNLIRRQSLKNGEKKTEREVNISKRPQLLMRSTTTMIAYVNLLKQVTIEKEKKECPPTLDF